MMTNPTRAALRLFMGAAALAFASFAGAASLSLSQSTATAPPSTIFIDVKVLDVDLGKAVGAFDITLSYDASA